MVSNLKTLKRVKKLFEYYVNFFTDVIIYKHFLKETELLLVFVR